MRRRLRRAFGTAFERGHARRASALSFADFRDKIYQQQALSQS
jgi:hypothetical protein